MSVRADRRGVSPVLAYTLTLAIAALLVTGLLVAAGTYVTDQRERAMEGELKVIGQQVSADISAVSRLSRADGAGTAEITRTLQNGVSGSPYTIEVVDDGEGPTEPYLRLSTDRPEVIVTIGISTTRAIDTDSIAGGGALVVEFDGTQVVVRNE